MNQNSINNNNDQRHKESSPSSSINNNNDFDKSKNIIVIKNEDNHSLKQSKTENIIQFDDNNKMKQYLWILPLIPAILIPIDCILPYYLAIKSNHVAPIFPYVSDAASYSPAANIFSQIMDIICISVTIVGLIRYKQVNYLINVMINKQNDEINLKIIKSLQNANFIALISSIIASFGGIMVGNFRENELFWLHIFGALSLFSGFAIFMFVQTFLCWHCYKQQLINYKTRPISMIIICIMLICFLPPFLYVTIYSVSKIGLDQFLNVQYRYFWPKNEIAYVEHIISTIFEWILINIASVYYFLLAFQMKKFGKTRLRTFYLI